MSEAHIAETVDRIGEPAARRVHQALVETGEAAQTATQSVENQRWALPSFLADIATMGTGTLLAGLLNAVLVFLIPRLVSVEDFGYWRMFLLYAGYVGFLHLGFADGALLRWAGRPLADFHHEIRPSLKFLFWQHAVLLTPLCVIIAFLLPPGLRFVGIAVLAYAPIYNLTATLQFGLQAARHFTPVAVSAVGPLALFLLCISVRSLFRSPGIVELVLAWFAAWSLAFVFLLFATGSWERRTSSPPFSLARDTIHAGWPVMVANTGIGLILFADRLVLSWAAEIRQFAQYSLAATAISVLIPAIQASSRVLLPHLAGLDTPGRVRAYRTASNIILLTWCLLLPYYLALDVFVRNFLPNYIYSLEIARLLVLGILFQASIQVLHASFAYVCGRGKRFLAHTMGMLVMSLAAATFAALQFRSIVAVAVVQVVLLGLWWLLNEVSLQDLTGRQWRDWVRYMIIFVTTSLVYWSTMRPGSVQATSVLRYYGAVAVVLLVVYRNELLETMRFALQLRGYSAQASNRT